MIRPTPSSTARVELGDGLVVAVEADPRRGEAGPLGDAPARRRSRRRGTGPPRRPSARPSCRGRPCRRRRRRSRRRRRGRRGPGRGSRPRRGRTPGCRARATRSRSVDAADAQHAVGLRARSATTAAGPARWGRSGSRSQAGPRSGAVGVRPAGLVRWHDSHPLGGGDAEQVEAVGEHRPGRVRPAPAGPGAGRRRLLVAAAAAPGSCVVALVERRRRCPRGSARPGAARAARRRLATTRGNSASARSSSPSLSCVEQRRGRTSSATLMPRSAALRRIAADAGRGRTARSRPGCRCWPW